MNELKGYVLKVLGLTAAILVLAFSYSVLAPEHLKSRVLVYIPLFFFVISVSAKALFLWSWKNDARKLAHATLAISGFRFFLYLVAILAYSFFTPDDAVPFLISFFVVYLFYAVFDSVWNYKRLKIKKNNYTAGSLEVSG